MKKFFEKHDLVKISLGMILLCFLLTWIIPKADFSTGKLVVGDITRMGLFDMFTYSIVYFCYYFGMIATFILILGAFYQLLSKLGAYQKLTDKLASKIKGKEILFSLIVSFIFAALTSIFNEYLVLVVFVPFIITLCSKAGINKISSFAMTFGSILLGVLGSVIGTKIVGMNVQYFSLKYTTRLWTKIIFFAIAYILYNGLSVLYLIKNKKNSKSKTAKAELKNDESVDLFENEVKNSSKSNTIPLIIVGIIFALIAILAYLPWTEVFKVTWFTDAYNWVTTTNVFGSPLMSYILGSVLTEFGSWDIVAIQIVMILTMIVLQICYKVSVNDFLESFADGIKKVGKLVGLLFLAYVILIFSVIFQVIPTIADKIVGTKFNVFTTGLTGMLSGLFTGDYQYAVNMIYYNIATFSGKFNVVSLILQYTFGLMSFITPASALLFVGLSYLDISYKEYIKYIWKFLVAILVAIIILALIVA